MKDCRFCQKPMLPCINEFPADMDITVEYTHWECHYCPRTVKEYDDTDLWFCITSFYNGSWYEVMQSYICTDPKCIPSDSPLTSIYKYTMYEDFQERPNIKSELVLELNEDIKVTPQNVDEKLALLLTFS